MVPRTAASGAAHPDAIEFVRFCYHRRRVGWPELYDEMCAVAGRGLFRGFSADDLGGIGVGFSLFDMPALANLASWIVAEEVALRRPVIVVLNETVAMPDVGPGDARDSSVQTPTAEPKRATRVPTPLVTTQATGSSPSPTPDAATDADERTFDVPIRLALVHSGA